MNTTEIATITDRTERVAAAQAVCDSNPARAEQLIAKYRVDSPREDADTYVIWASREIIHANLMASRASRPLQARMPKGFHIDRSTDELRCPHRDLSCCPQCFATYPNIVEVYGVHYWARSADEVAALTEMVS